MKSARRQRRMLRRALCGLAASTLLLAASRTPAHARAEDPAMVRVQGGAYRPFFKGQNGTPPIPVSTFLLDREPVTRAQFAAFLAREPRWRKSRVPALFAERGYLEGWTAGQPRTDAARGAMTNVSWFAARAYCECEGKRLPTQAEWEWAAEGDRSDAPAVRAAIANRPLRDAGTSGTLRFAMGQSGAAGLEFGDVWEWTDDFDALIAPNPSPDEPSSSLFCGDGFRATDARDYAGFLRFSFRRSLKASYTLRNLGFRCARSLTGGAR